MGGEEKDEVCLTEECVTAAADIIRNMNQSVDPCSDFYQFSCGGFLEKTFIPEDKSWVSSFTPLGDKVKERKRKLLEAEPGPLEPNVYQSARNLYKSCMDEEEIDKNSKSQLKKYLVSIGQENWFDSKTDLYRLIEKSAKLGFSPSIFSIGITADNQNSSRRIIHVDEPRLGLPRDYLIKGPDDKVVKAYYNYICLLYTSPSPRD